MNKFSGPDDQDYCAVAGKIKMILRKIRTNSLLEEADAWICNRQYTTERLKIERLSGETLPIAQCYINLAIVEHANDVRDRSKGRSQEEKEGGTATLSSPFSLAARLKIEAIDKTRQVELTTLFDPRKGPDGRTSKPRRILIRGRAGVGKTTLCKKIIHDFTNNKIWNDLFSRVLWVPLRRLKQRHYSEYNLESLFLHIYFEEHRNRKRLAEELWRAIEDKNASSRGTLFILDGLDEVSELLDSSHSAFNFLTSLLNRSNVIITSRPHAIRFASFEKLDLELETIGFRPEQVTDYLKKTIGNQLVDQIQLFLRDRSLIQGLVRIPIQLDALCFTWNEGFVDGSIPETMTAVYQALAESLWKKDLCRLQLARQSDIRYADLQHIETFVPDEMLFLQGLGFTGLHSNMVDFEPRHRNQILKLFNLTKRNFLPDRVLPCLSFLRTSDPLSEYGKQSYHFLHLTFQEYFAAQYFVRQWKDRNPLRCLDLSSRKHRDVDPSEFLREYKYNGRYDVFWRFVTGLFSVDVNGEGIVDFFERVEDWPLDLLGPAHQRLVMHCLSEVPSSTNLLIRPQLETKLKRWLLFECSIAGDVFLAREAEFPERPLRDALEAGSGPEMLRILEALYYRSYLPYTLIKTLENLLKDTNEGIRRAAARALGEQPSLPDSTITALVGLLQGGEIFVRYAAAHALGKQSSLPDSTIAALVGLLQDSEGDVRRAAADALGRQSSLPDSAIAALVGLLQDSKGDVRYAATDALGKQSRQIMESLGFSNPNGLETIRKPFTYSTEFMEPLYLALLYLSFREQLSWYVVKNNNEDSLFVLYTQDGSREAFISQGQLDRFWGIVDKARHGSGIDSYYWIWERKERKERKEREEREEREERTVKDRKL